MHTATNTYAVLQEDIAEINHELGWYDTERTYREGLALIATEISEALDAYREHGLSDVTIGSCPPGAHTFVPHTCKPEGVGSELADVLIRVLDQLTRSQQFAIEPSRSDIAFAEMTHKGLTFGEDMWELHRILADRPLHEMVAHLVHVADKHGIDLLAETRRKMAFNRTRGYRHGGKRL